MPGIGSSSSTIICEEVAIDGGLEIATVRVSDGIMGDMGVKEVGKAPGGGGGDVGCGARACMAGGAESTVGGGSITIPDGRVVAWLLLSLLGTVCSEDIGYFCLPLVMTASPWIGGVEDDPSGRSTCTDASSKVTMPNPRLISCSSSPSSGR